MLNKQESHILDATVCVALCVLQQHSCHLYHALQCCQKQIARRSRRHRKWTLHYQLLFYLSPRDACVLFDAASTVVAGCSFVFSGPASSSSRPTNIQALFTFFLRAWDDELPSCLLSLGESHSPTLQDFQNHTWSTACADGLLDLCVADTTGGQTGLQALG